MLLAAISDKAEGERILQASSLEWVIIRPVGLKEAPASGDYLAGPIERVRLFSALSYADCAACLLRAATEQNWKRQIINLGCK
jgi:uncharacterized protein YbjT (DUF2867 family)